MNEQNKLIIQLLAEGLTVKEAAAKMNMNPRTVEGWIYKMRKKLNCKTVTELVMKVKTEV